MFDEKYMKSKDKPINTIEDAIFAIAAHRFCGGASCSTCGTRMYGDDCSLVKKQAIDFLASCVTGKKFDPDETKGSKNQQLAYDALLGKDKKAPKGLKQDAPKKGKVEPPKTCEQCYHSKTHTSGILFCESFHNFVHTDGYCYRFAPSVKMEK